MKFYNLLLLSVLSLPLWAQEATTPSISVQGNGHVVAVPDAFSITFLVEAKGETVSKLNAEVRQATQQIISFLRGQSVDEQNIQTMQIRLSPNYERFNNGQREQNGFVLSRSIKISHSELDSYDKIIDGVLRAGANRIEQFDFVVTNQSELYEQALVAAVKDAKMKATLMLKPAGAELGPLISVNEHSINPRINYSKMMMAEADTSTALPGTESITAQISVTFAIQ
ncbi:SIMPL domain-containing protein [Alteromonas facilis]|uniref:SIMPL domain-containing protein n=1 Tax=Alteromonas facilis TaxID=2048004 RepID=UPI000C2926A9|nr:SIMPL domain-containing protein [Alteromonas facilis]